MSQGLLLRRAKQFCMSTMKQWYPERIFNPRAWKPDECMFHWGYACPLSKDVWNGSEIGLLAIPLERQVLVTVKCHRAYHSKSF